MISQTKKIIKKVAFFGDSTAIDTQKHFKDAFNCAKLLAKNGYTIVNGGGPGVMLAATLGAKAGGGRVEVAILDPKKEPNNYESTSAANLKLADKKYLTHSYPARVNKLISLADAFVIFKGGTGTLSEIGMVWELAKFDYGDHEPLIFVGSIWRDIIKNIVTKLEYDSKERHTYQVVDNPQSVLTILKRIES